MKKEFKAFDKVIVKSQTDDYWTCDLYSHLNEDMGTHETISRIDLYDNDILPYEGHEHLVGSDQNPDEEVRLEEGEFLICFDCMDYFEAKDFCLSPFNALRESTVRTKDGNNWSLFIRFSDFNSNDMEETKAKILCVRNGKIVRYKG